MRTSLLCAFLCLSAFIARGAFLRDVPVTVRQPDGTVLPCYASGDEFYNWLHDRQGFTIVQDPATGMYVYAQRSGDRLISTRVVAGHEDPGSAGLTPYATISAAAAAQIRAAMPWYEPPARALAPRTGVLNNVVIFIRFSDDAEFTDPPSKYDNAFNVTTPGVNSMYNYFKEVSYGRLEVFTTFYPLNIGATVLSYQDIQPRAYFLPYSATNTGGYVNDQYTRERELLVRAAASVSAQIPTGLVVDGDNDGYTDNVCFIVRGTPSAWATLLWPHMSSMGSSGPTLGGKKIGAYNFQIESMAGVNVLSHEMMHTLGAPDTYRYASPDAVAPTGAWDIMASTSNPPQHSGAYLRYRYMTWISSLPKITTSGRYALHPVSSPTNNCYRIDSPNPGEFFVLEYRKKTSIFENSLPGQGLLVYRIDSLISGNANGPPDGIYIYRPGGNPTTSWPPNGSLNQAAFNASGRTAINDTTDPACVLTSGARGNLDISDVSAIGDSIAFTVTITEKKPEWTLSRLSPANEVNDIAFPQAQSGWAAGSSILFRSTNSGGTWVNLPNRPVATLYGVTAVDNMRAWAVGSTAVYRTTDGGSSWNTTFLTIPGGGRLYAISMLSASTGWVSGAGGTLYKTTNGGNNWTLVTTGTPRILRAFHFRDEAHGWAVGDGGTVASTSDSGSSWSVATFTDTLAFNGVAFADSLTGVIVGRYGRVYRTTNGGALWTIQSIPTRSHLNAVAFHGRDSGWIAGDNGTILQTTDGGTAWRGTVSGTMVNLRCIAPTDARIQWIAGSSGTILRTPAATTGIDPDDVAAQPLMISLAQNYPNPFNPATTISYAVPRVTHGPGMVELKVYDLLGREVATLVHQPQGPGEYTVPFHATGLASGVYVYRLAIDGTTAARTMLLMK